MTREQKTVNAIKTILKDEGFELIPESKHGYNLGYVNTPFGELHITTHNNDDSIYAKFVEYEKIPDRIKLKAGISRTGKWNFYSTEQQSATEQFQSMFRTYITAEAAWHGWFENKMMEEAV